MFKSPSSYRSRSAQRLRNGRGFAKIFRGSDCGAVEHRPIVSEASVAHCTGDSVPIRLRFRRLRALALLTTSRTAPWSCHPQNPDREHLVTRGLNFGVGKRMARSSTCGAASRPRAGTSLRRPNRIPTAGEDDDIRLGVGSAVHDRRRVNQPRAAPAICRPTRLGPGERARIAPRMPF